jgi:lipoprotein-releasing system permease protein
MHQLWRLYELKIALHYLRPRWRHLSSSIISCISTVVIALVVCLIVVFFSVTHGLEQSWLHKLVAITAPVRIKPTPDYYQSYYYLADSVSAAADYSLKSIHEKQHSAQADAYDPFVDGELPPEWPQPIRTATGEVKDLVQEVFAAVAEVKTQLGVSDLQAYDYELSPATLQLQMERNNGYAGLTQEMLLATLDPRNTALNTALLPPKASDIDNALRQLHIANMHNGSARFHSTKQWQELLSQFFNHVEVTSCCTAAGWLLPSSLLPEHGTLAGHLYLTPSGHPYKLQLPSSAITITQLCQSLQKNDEPCIPARLSWKKDSVSIETLNGTKKHYSLSRIPQLQVTEPLSFTTNISSEALKKAHHREQIVLQVTGTLQNTLLKGSIPLRGLEIEQFQFKQPLHTDSVTVALPWLHVEPAHNLALNTFSLPTIDQGGDGIVIPKKFRDAGVLVGDRGWLTYAAQTASASHAQRWPVQVAGFYDPGIISAGGSFILGDRHLAAQARAAQQHDEVADSNGIQLTFNDLAWTSEIQQLLQKKLEERGIAPFWQIETFQDLPQARDLLQQLASERNLFTLLAAMIIAVACSNIVSMLIILVNDKKQEIGILRAMGATTWSVAAIFGCCGALIGLSGSLLGILLALTTLYYLPFLIQVLSQLQGQELFNPLFYGEHIPATISYDAILFVCIATGTLSLLAGIIPALRAACIRPAELLRTE